MGKYKKLRDETLRRLLEYRQKLELIKKEINETSFIDLNRLYELSEDLSECIYDLSEADMVSRLLIEEDKKIMTMLNGFYDVGLCYKSFLYKPIEKICGKEYKYCVEDKYFRTLQEAKEYSISLGERDDWLDYAYNYL